MMKWAAIYKMKLADGSLPSRHVSQLMTVLQFNAYSEEEVRSAV